MSTFLRAAVLALLPGGYSRRWLRVGELLAQLDEVRAQRVELALAESRLDPFDWRNFWAASITEPDRLHYLELGIENELEALR